MIATAPSAMPIVPIQSQVFIAVQFSLCKGQTPQRVDISMSVSQSGSTNDLTRVMKSLSFRYA
jgi:hypothetical protein